MNIALIKAGGVGSRMNAGIPKQFVSVNDVPVIIYTLKAFDNHPNIDEIFVVCVDGWHDVLWSYINKYDIKKVKNIISGGTTSLRSIKCGVEEIYKEHNRDDLILIHDANRPLVSEDIISDVIVNSKIYGNAVAAIPCTDEVMVSEKDNESTIFLDRKTLFRIQTPDAYSLGIIFDILDNATDEELDYVGATNTLVIKKGGTMHLAKGSEINIRLTTQEDIDLFKAILDLRSKSF